MEKNQVYNKLYEVYTEKNLNQISSKIIDCYKSKRYAYILEINQIVFENKVDKDEKIGKIFNRLIMLYHPDKLNYFIKQIDDSLQKNNNNNLDELSKIFLILDLKDSSIAYGLSDNDFCFEAEYVWDYEQEGFSYFTEENEVFFDIDKEDEVFKPNKITFFSALKRREYGSMNVDFPVHQLYDSEELELADYEIDDLEGVEFCKHLKILDLANNNISDISKLSFIKSIEELYLSQNKISFIDRIHALKKLRVIDLSDNKVDDLSALLYLNNLEYVNIVGNNVPHQQIEMLKQKGTIVVH